MPISTISVARELHVAAPEGRAVYAQSVQYTDALGVSLLEARRHEALHFDAQGRRVYYNACIDTRRSDDHGVTWTDERVWTRETPDTLDGEKEWAPNLILDARRNVLIAVSTVFEIDTREGMFHGANRRQRTARLRYRISRDGGHSWSAPRWAVDARPGHGPQHCAPGIRYGETGISTEFQPGLFLPDGSFLLACTVRNALPPSDTILERDREGIYGCVCARVRWTDDGEDLLWHFGSWLLVPPEVAAGGCCEGALAWMGGERLCMVMRCQGDEATGLYASRQCALSEDGGATWGAPEPLRYDDGTPVWTPASLSQFIHSTKTGKTYWLANILPGPVYGQTPRYPLALAEFDTARGCIRREGVHIIQDLPPGAPAERRYTNWGLYEERGTGDLILTLPEQPKDMDFSAMTRPEDFTADCLRYRVRLSEG